MNLTRLLQLGFNGSTQEPGSPHISVKCDSCEACVINGTPCHEIGCQEQTHECRGCDEVLTREQGKYCETCC